MPLDLAESRPSTDAARWHAVERRDPRADGRFWYSVDSTGVYCRPSCPSRPKRRANVRFHESPGAAEAAGFRACKRCDPRGTGRDARRADAVARACRTIEAAEEQPRLAALARDAGMSRFHFQRVFKEIAGVTPRGFAAAVRARRLHAGLKGARSVTEAYFDAGFNSSGRFYESAGDLLGMTPRQYRRGGEGTAIRFAVARCALGKVLVAATSKGLCAVALGDDPEKLRRDLRARFPRAELSGGGTEFGRLVARVVALVERPEAAPGLPLDLRGTSFQQRVWQALRRIPPGATASYSDIAKRIGKPNAVRAVASACAANPVAVAVPCHRVVRQDGGLGGYRWGLAKKRALLKREAEKTIR